MRLLLLAATHGRLDVDDLVDMPVVDRSALIADLAHLAEAESLEVT